MISNTIRIELKTKCVCIEFNYTMVDTCTNIFFQPTGPIWRQRIDEEENE
jgi:hypothetical protein